jgi:hypothetical protein
VIREAGGTEAGIDGKTQRAGFMETQRMSSEKLLDFFEILQLLDFDPRPCRSNGSI